MNKNGRESFARLWHNSTKKQRTEIILKATPDQLASVDQLAGGQHRSSYAKMKREAAARMASSSRIGRDIGPPPPIEKPRRKSRAGKNLEYFCRSYFPETFTLKWSPDHLKVLKKTETAVLEGGLFAVAMPRGSGKTTIAETAALWSLVYGHRDFVCVIGPSEQAALEVMQSIKAELEQNDRLLADFPEVCFPIRALEGIANRTAGQLCDGRRTRITWTSNQIVLPQIEGSAAAGAVVQTTGITGRIRGMKHKRPDGSSVRPSLVICDDPSTDSSARSPSENFKRESILAGAVLGLAGPGKKISGIVPCTVIQQGDLADRILNTKLHPEFMGERTALVYQWPKNAALWDKYAELRADSFRAGGNGKEATSYYRKNRKKMDEGARVAWPQRKNRDELSALQHAYNLRLRDERAFFSEYQNEPLAPPTDSGDLPTPIEIASKLNGYKRRVIPLDAENLVAFIDVQKNALYWLAIAWSPGFTGYVIDYGTWPEQPSRYFRLTDVKRTLGRAAPRAGLEGAIYKGLDSLVSRLASTTLKRDDGAEVKFSRILIDANWGLSTDTVYSFCRQSAHRGLVIPSHGRGVGASSLPFAEYRKKPGDLVGLNWRIPAIKGRRVIRHVIYDTNFWKSFSFSRLSTPLGDPGALSLYQAKDNHHRLLSDQLAAEYRITVTGRGRSVDEWRHKPEHFDNHFLDCLVGCSVAGSIEGAALATFGNPPPAKRRKPGPRRPKVQYF